MQEGDRAAGATLWLGQLEEVHQGHEARGQGGEGVRGRLVFCSGHEKTSTRQARSLRCGTGRGGERARHMCGALYAQRGAMVKSEHGVERGARLIMRLDGVSLS